MTTTMRRITGIAVLLLAGIGVVPLSMAVRAQPAELPASTRLAMPGEKHRWLEPLIGQWNVQMRVWPAPGDTPIESTQLTATREWILGGRYLREELTGKFAGNPSHRVALLGYNNLEGRFELVTVDTFEPGQMSYASLADGKPGLISLTGDNTEAGFGAKPTGRKRSLRFDIEMAGDVNTQHIYVRYPGETEFLFVEQRFTKAR
jgi:Protein of unknown function (DUF1579)